MTVPMSMNDVLQSLRMRAQEACELAQVVHAQAEEARARATVVAAKQSALNEKVRRMRAQRQQQLERQPTARPTRVAVQKMRLNLALQEEHAALPHVDRRVRTRWLLQTGGSLAAQRQR